MRWQADPPPSIDRRNAAGVTVRSLAAAMMSRDDVDDWCVGRSTLLAAVQAAVHHPSDSLPTLA